MLKKVANLERPFGIILTYKWHKIDILFKNKTVLILEYIWHGSLIDFVDFCRKRRLGEGAKKKVKKITSVSFMYVCVAENAELLVFFYFFFAPSP